MTRRIDPSDNKVKEYCDSFKNDQCVRCGQPMGHGIGTIECHSEKK